MARAQNTAAGNGRFVERSLTSFALRFFGYLFAASLVFSLGGLHGRLEPVQSGIASAAAFLAALLGTSVYVSGPLIATGSGPSLLVNHECTGIFILIIWGAFLLAHRARWRDRLWGFFTGVAIIQLVNVARLATLAAIGARYPRLFDYFHEYLWQGVFVAMIAVLAASWRENVEKQALVSS